jgi:hypothetical protein
MPVISAPWEVEIEKIVRKKLMGPFSLHKPGMVVTSVILTTQEVVVQGRPGHKAQDPI